jgi:hypothetical protein
MEGRSHTNQTVVSSKISLLKFLSSQIRNMMTIVTYSL